MATPIAIAVVQQDDRFLIGPRPEGVPLPHYWEFPGGKIEPGETPQAAAARECLEETGIAVVVGEECYHIEHEYEHGRVELHFFRCVPVDPLQKPRGRFDWENLHAMARYRFPPANEGLVHQLLRYGGIDRC